MENFLEKNEKIVLSLLFILTLFLIFFHFTDTPKVWVDEGVFTGVARSISVSGVQGLQIAPHQFFGMSSLLSTGYPVIYPVAGVFSLFGLGIVEARLPMLMYMVLLVIVFYLFMRKKYGVYNAIVSTLLLLSFSPFYGNGRPVQGEVPGLFFLVFGLYSLLFLEESSFKSKKWALLSGLGFGLACATKPIYLILISLSLFVVFVIWFRNVFNKNIIFFIGGLALPIIFWVITLSFGGESLSHIIPTYVNLSSNHESSISLATTVLTNFKKFFTEVTPILFILLLATVGFSFVLRLYRSGVKDFSITEHFLVSFIILNFLAYLPGTGWYRYFFPASILVYLLFSRAISCIKDFFKNDWIKKTLYFIPIFLILFQFYHLVFLSDTSFVVQRNRNVELSKNLGSIDTTKTIFFYNTPEAVVFFKGNNYSQYVSMGNFLNTGNHDLILRPNYDYILVDNGTEGQDISIKCYNKRSINGYYLFEKMNGCKR